MGYRNPFDRKAIGLDADQWTDPNRDDLGTPTPPTPPPATVPPPATPPTTPPPATPPPPPKTNGYATPGYTAPTPGKVMAGWEQSKWDDPTHQSPKYVVGRILSNYPDNPGGLTSAMADIQKAYPGSSLLDGGKSGKINIPGVGVIDVGVSFGSGGGHGWAWQDQAADDTAVGQAHAIIPGNLETFRTTDTAGLPAPNGGETLEQMLTRVFGYHPKPATPPPTPPTPPTTPPGAPPAKPPAPVTDYSENNFDSQAYLTANPDVAAHWGSSAYQHYIQYGRKEGRAFTPRSDAGATGSGVVMPTGQPAADGSTTWAPGAAVPSMPGYVYNAFGGFERAGASSTPPPTGTTSTTSNTSNGSNITPGQYDDPATNDMLEFIRTMLPGLIQQGTQTPQSVQQLIAALNGAAVNTANSPETARLQDLLTQAIGRANGPAYDDSQKSILRADALAQLQASHDHAMQQVNQDLAARNIPLDSGVALQMRQHVADLYAQNKSMVERGLSIDEINKLDSNRAMGLQAAGESANIATTQQSKVLEFMKLATDMESGDVTRRNAAMQSALQLFGIPVQIADQRFQDANAAANGVSANPSSLLSTLATIAANNRANDINSQNSSRDMWTNIAKAVATIDWTGKKDKG